MLAFAVISLSAAAQTTAQNEWTWMGGSSTVGTGGVVPGVYGTLGTPAPGNIPGSRVGAASWTDSSGHLWLFGGEGFGASGAVDFLNDLWEFNPSTNQWSWMGGTSTPERQCVDNQGEILCGQSGVYGTLGTAAPENFPGGRSNAVSWTDKSGDLWLYGGGGWDSAGQDGVLNDLWEFNPAINQWTWIGGSSTIPANLYGRPGVYGTMGTPAAGNDPGALVYAFSWTDERGNSWLFGGWGYDVNDENGLPNNLWKFDASVGEWAWIEGSPAYDTPWVHPTVYGTKGIPTSGNIPGSRWQGSAWTDNNGNLWLFGGQGYDLQGNSGFLNELWEFDPITNQWAWMAGQSVMDGWKLWRRFRRRRIWYGRCAICGQHAWQPSWRRFLGGPERQLLALRWQCTRRNWQYWPSKRHVGLSTLHSQLCCARLLHRQISKINDLNCRSKRHHSNIDHTGQWLQLRSNIQLLRPTLRGILQFLSGNSHSCWHSSHDNAHFDRRNEDRGPRP